MPGLLWAWIANDLSGSIYMIQYIVVPADKIKHRADSCLAPFLLKVGQSTISFMLLLAEVICSMCPNTCLHRTATRHPRNQPRSPLLKQKYGSFSHHTRT